MVSVEERFEGIRTERGRTVGHLMLWFMWEIMGPNQGSGDRSREGQIDRGAAQELIKSAQEPRGPLPGTLPASEAF